MLEPEKKARKWKSEIQLATKREKDWRERADKVVKRYRGEERKRNSFNILWANTEILRPAIYNSSPSPDVRRRFRDADPLGKAVSEIIERCLSVFVDDYSFECAIKNDVLDTLLPGRGISRLRYKPKIGQRPQLAKKDAQDETEPKVEETLEYEQLELEHVDWQDYRQGYGRVWAEVPWVAYRCKLTDDEAATKFGRDAIKDIKFSSPMVDDKDKDKSTTASETQNIAEFWEVWDKDSKTVFFQQDDSKTLLYPLDTPNGEPPLDLVGFFASPEPLQIVENTGSMIPIPIYTLYEQQAAELDRISNRINKIVDACKLRGVYDSTLPEMSDLMKGEDNDLTPVSKAQAWMTNGGIDKAISWMPTDQAAKVLEILNTSRESSKQIIYEITGISDIIRGASMASETATAQQIKANYASVRLQRMQKEVQRYVRDILRIAAEIIANKFEQPTLASMTGLQFPTQQQQAMAQQQMQMQAQQAQQSGQPPPPPDPGMQAILKTPPWEAIMGTLRNDALRQFKIDVETDSTVAGSLESDMQGLSQVIESIGQTLTVFAPLVLQKMLPVDAAKEIVMSVVRRAKMGLAVEDALDKIQTPEPPPAEQQQPDHSLEVAQINAQKDAQIAQMTQQHEKEVEGAKMQAEAAKAQAEQQLEQMRLTHEQQLEQMRLENQRMIADAANQTNLMIADMKGQQAREAQANQLVADQQRQETQIAADSQKQAVDTQSRADLAGMKVASTDAPPAADYKDVESTSKLDAHLEAMNKLIPVMSEAVFHMSRPKKIVRDAGGKIAGFE